MISRLNLATAALSATLALSPSVGAAVAQTPAPAAASTAAPMAPVVKKGEKPRTAQSLECSRKADAQNVHGKPRKTFMSKCKAGKA